MAKIDDITKAHESIKTHARVYANETLSTGDPRARVGRFFVLEIDPLRDLDVYALFDIERDLLSERYIKHFWRAQVSEFFIALYPEFAYSRNIDLTKGDEDENRD